MDYTLNIVSKCRFFFICKHSRAPNRSWKIFLGVFTDKNAGLFQDPMENFPGPVPGPRMLQTGPGKFFMGSWKSPGFYVSKTVGTVG